MNYALSANADKQLKKLPQDIQKKFLKQVRFLIKNPQHPSLRARKKGGEDVYEARVDYHNRFSYVVEGGEITILTVGPHDVGLDKK